MRPTANAFDFDDWAELARRDDEAFESRRRACIEDYIEGVSESARPRLRHLQWRIEMERRRSRNPLQACLRLSGMMWDNVLDDHNGLRGALTALGDLARGELPAARESAAGGTGVVLPFRPGRRR